MLSSFSYLLILHRNKSIMVYQLFAFLRHQMSSLIQDFHIAMSNKHDIATNKKAPWIINTFMYWQIINLYFIMDTTSKIRINKDGIDKIKRIKYWINNDNAYFKWYNRNTIFLIWVVLKKYGMIKYQKYGILFFYPISFSNDSKLDHYV